MVGSAVTSDHPTDIDILLITTDQKKSLESIKVFSRTQQLSIFQSDDAFRFSEDPLEVSLVPKSARQVKTELRHIIQGKNLGRSYRPWAVGGYFPEVLVADLLQAVPLWENGDAFIKSLKRYLNTKLPSFFRKLQEYLQEEIDLKSNYLTSGPPRNPLFQKTLQTDLDIAHARLAFARDNQVFPGIKRFTDNLAGLSPDSQNIVRNILDHS